MFFLYKKHIISVESKKINHKLIDSLTTASVCRTGTYDSPCTLLNNAIKTMKCAYLL